MCGRLAGGGSPPGGLVLPRELSDGRVARPLSVGAPAACPPAPSGAGAPRRSAPLIGRRPAPATRLHLRELPTSYRDFYVELSRLSPHTEQTTQYLVCGAVLNAGGRGECTGHAARCGAGSGLFFLLQDCVGLIVHGSQAAYVHSPYVDSHRETLQFQGRPLNLDADRYGILEELWHSHQVKQRVITEQGNARQLVIPDFY